MKIEEIINTFNPHQSEMFDILVKESKYQFRVPTGVGKGYVMIGNILYSILKTDLNKFAIASHRLSLNNQHLRDLIDKFVDLNLLNKVKFLTVGSQVLDINKLWESEVKLSQKFNNLLIDHNLTLDIRNRITQEDIFQSSMSKSEINSIIQKNDSEGIKTVIITTYNSLDKLSDIELDVIHLDEAHILATNREEADFRKSYEIIKSKKRFFYTATPKDMQEEILKEDGSSDIFLMNNEEIFGRRYEVAFVECVRNGYITEPIIHIAHPKDLNDGENYDSIENKSKFVKETFEAHQDWLKKSSFISDEIDAKMLVRCESVPAMWDMYHQLRSIMPNDVIICAGASYNETGEANHVMGNFWERNRDEFLKKLQKVESNKKMIILNFDIFSEGINVSGITGVMFLQGKMPSIAKVIQNVGRSTRLHPFDRLRLRTGEIKVGGKDWVKPNCAVIIPYWDSTSLFTKNLLADIIRKLRSKMEFSPNMILSVGDDFAKSDVLEDLDGLNKLDRKPKKWKMIEELTQEIEKLDLQDINQKEIERIQGLSKLQLLREKFGKQTT